MDSKAILDYAVFHLTPTRTRCDLVLFRGKSSEKLASGLVEPFVSHLQYAKDQIPKGGYSITLCPPSSSGEDDDDDAAPWFTKTTFQRFVRFVSTPEILERIMRLEREILQIESSLQSNEILRIEEASHQGEGSSPVSNGMTKKSTNSSSAEEEDGSLLRESSKVQLQRLMDTRKALLLKEQAMAYARAVVAGYEIETIDDLISFADAFGAARLRAACTDFKYLYKKKHSDDQWMDELAAVQAYPVHDLSYMGTSGIMLAGENFHNNATPLARTGSSEPLSDTSDGSKENNTAPELNSNVQQQMPWMNQIPQYMYGYQMPPPYQGYPMPYFPGHMGFPPPKDHKKHKSSKKKDKNSGASESSEEEEEQITSSDDSSSSNDDSSKGKRQSKKKKKKSSKTVVIRNINYITSQKRSGEEDEASDEESSEDVSLDEASIREGVDNAIASLERRNGNNHGHSKARKNGGKHAQNVEQEFGYNEADVNGGKASNPWGAFQNLLLSHEDSASNDRKQLNMEAFDEHFFVNNSNGTISNGANGDFHLESEKIKKHPTADDSVLMVQRNGVNGFRGNTLDFTNGEATNPMMKKQIVSEGESALFSQQTTESRSDGLDFSSESARKIPRGDDWFVANASGNSQTLNHKQLDFNYDGDFIKKETSNEASAADDSFIIESRRLGFDDPYASQWKTDITTMFDKTSQAANESPTNPGLGLSRSMEPDELCMVLARESNESTASWAPEMDYAAEISFTEVDKKRSTVKEVAADAAAAEENGKSGGGKKTTKTPVKDMRSKSLSRSRLDSLAKSKTTPASRSTMQKSKLQREEEERKRLEELVIQRQKRIAERTASNNGLSPGASKKLTNKTTPPKLAKNNSIANGTKSLNQSKLAA